jgi:hypothetical protein
LSAPAVDLEIAAECEDVTGAQLAGEVYQTDIREIGWAAAVLVEVPRAAMAPFDF